ncbi:helix-turn-helix domain-containing protein, partial [Salmonella enterica]|nr:helix-turn-helix domain-containing protein [Salmonella enterica]
NYIFNDFNYMEEQYIKKAAICFLLSCFHMERDFFPFFLSFYSMGHKISVIIKTDLRHQWRLSEIANVLCLCMSTVKKNLKKEGTSFIKILTECRVQHAARLLLISEKNINSISAECGYNNVSYFIMTFSNYYGLSPHHYAQKHSCLSGCQPA